MQHSARAGAESKRGPEHGQRVGDVEETKHPLSSRVVLATQTGLYRKSRPYSLYTDHVPCLEQSSGESSPERRDESDRSTCSEPLEPRSNPLAYRTIDSTTSNTSSSTPSTHVPELATTDSESSVLRALPVMENPGQLSSTDLSPVESAGDTLNPTDQPLVQHVQLNENVEEIVLRPYSESESSNCASHADDEHSDGTKRIPTKFRSERKPLAPLFGDSHPSMKASPEKKRCRAVCMSVGDCSADLKWVPPYNNKARPRAWRKASRYETIPSVSSRSEATGSEISSGDGS